MAKELVIYIHGVTDKGQAHTADYCRLAEGVGRYCKELGKPWPRLADSCSAEWGWPIRGPANAASHELLSVAQEEFGRRARKVAGDADDFTLNPLRAVVNGFRGLMMHNFADMFYYVSMQGKRAVRLAVAQQILKCVKLDEPLSLTLLGHSAGTVVAFDLLFYLFYPGRGEEEFFETRSSKAQDVPGVDEAKVRSELAQLKKMVRDKQLRVRRLFTFGSPISALAYRSDAVLKILAKPGGRLDPAYHGLTGNPFPDELPGPRWLNFWDKDDPIAWPVEPLMNGAGEIVKDEYVDVDDSVINTHGAYWSSSRMHRKIAEAW